MALDQPIGIRLFEPSDRPAVQSLCIRVFQEHGWPMEAKEKEMPFDGLFAGERDRLFVVESQGEFAGMGGLKAINKTHVLLRRFYMEPVFRRQGIAAALLRHMERVALDLGYQTILLDVTRENLPAIAFYEKHGFSRYTPSDHAVFGEIQVRQPSVFWFYRKALSTLVDQSESLPASGGSIKSVKSIKSERLFMLSFAAADRVNLDEASRAELEKLAGGPIVWHASESASEAEVIARIGDAVVALTSFNTPMTAAVIAACPGLRYIGIAGTNLSNTDLKACAERGIEVRNVTDYADEATAEYLIARLIMLARGWGEYKWNPTGPTELTGKKLGLVGMGAVAQQMVKRALGMDMQVTYYSRTRKPEVEALGVRYLDLEQLARESDVVSLHVPKNVEVFSASHLALMRPGSVLVNACLGVTVAPEAVRDWLQQGNHFAIFDQGPDPVYHSMLAGLPGAILLPETAGITVDAKHRLGKKVVASLREWLRTGA